MSREPQPLQFHLDEHVSSAVAAALRYRGVQVTTTVEVGLRGASDEAHLAFALSAGRVMVTCDADYLRLHQKGVVHAGIVFCTGRPSPREVISKPLALYLDVDASEMWCRVEYA